MSYTPVKTVHFFINFMHCNKLESKNLILKSISIYVFIFLCPFNFHHRQIELMNEASDCLVKHGGINHTVGE